MLKTYKAILRGDTLEWVGERPAPSEQGSEVHVTVLENKTAVKRSDGAAMAEALRQISESGLASSFGDALEWQRETRKDRPLPGREE